MSRYEEMLTSIVNGDPITDEPICRREQYLKALANNEGVSAVPEPRCREEVLLQRLVEKGMDRPDQTKTVTPSSTQQTIVADSGYELGAVIVEAVPTTDRLQWKCDNVKNLQWEFYNYTGTSLDEVLIGLDTSQVTDMSYMFNSCKALTKIPLLNTSQVTKMKNMFYGCSNLQTIPQLDTSNATDMYGLFYSCSNLQTIPQLDTSNATDMTAFFNYCKALIEIPLIDTSQATNMSYMFQECDSLQTIPQLDTSSATDASCMFQECDSLQTIPQLNTNKVRNMSYMFNGCKALTTVELLDFRSATNVANIFRNCSSLINLTLKNITVTLQIGSGTTGGHLLTLDSLLNTIKELWDNSSNSSAKTLTVGSANLTKLENVYVKLIEITDEMRAEDEYIDNKYPFEVCQSTDEGAMHIINDYANMLKNWAIV